MRFEKKPWRKGEKISTALQELKFISRHKIAVKLTAKLNEVHGGRAKKEAGASFAF